MSDTKQINPTEFHEKRNDALDGLRCIAVLLVLGFHFRVKFFEAGYMGVDLFFVLSGYIITKGLLHKL
jgi:peptidoglycan/LPS O-acetylase OafA/YrhL